MFTEVHLNLVIHHPAMGCSYVQRKSSSTGKPSIQSYHCITQVQAAFGYYEYGSSKRESVSILLCDSSNEAQNPAMSFLHD